MGEKLTVMANFILYLCFEGFPLDFFPVLFAVPRVVGWLAHWRQVSNEPDLNSQVIDLQYNR